MKILSLGFLVIGIWSGLPGLRAETAYFVVGPIGGGPWGSDTNSFILPLSKPADISKARRIAAGIDNPSAISTDFGLDDWTPRFRIGLGSDGVNRDTYTAGAPLWSWHVKEFVDWVGDFIPEYPYHVPQQVEEAVQRGVLVEGQILRVGSYTVVEELTDTIRIHIIRSPTFSNRVRIYWATSPPSGHYALEWTTLLD